MDHWQDGRCGQSAVASAVNYFLGYRALTDDSVTQFTGETCLLGRCGLTTSQVQNAVNHYAEIYSLGSSGTTGFDMNTVVHEIDLNHPVIVQMTHMKLPPNSHFSVVIGYRFDPNTGTYNPFTYDEGFDYGWVWWRSLIVLDFSIPAPHPPPAPITTTVRVNSLPDSWQGPPANGWESDLRSTITVSYTFTGQAMSTSRITPFSFDADIGTQMILSVSNSPSGWTFTCNWDQYGIRRHDAECSMVVTVAGNDQIAAFFKQNPPPTPPCPDGQYWTGSQCACPSGQDWNGQQCVQEPQKPPSNECGGRVVSIQGGGISVFSIKPQIPFNNVQVWAFPISFLGQDPTTQIPIQYDVHATIAATYCQDGKSQQQNYVTPFSLWADPGTPITLNVLSPSGFACTWDHYGYQQHQTCTLTIQVGQDDKIVAFFQLRLPAYQSDSNTVLVQPTEAPREGPNRNTPRLMRHVFVHFEGHKQCTRSHFQ